MPEVRPFLRHDREQLADPVNAHVKAVIPGCSVPVATLLSQMERDPGEYIVDPWVIERETWVAIEDERLVPGVHLDRYGNESTVGPALRNAAGIDWLVCWPSKTFTAMLDGQEVGMLEVDDDFTRHGSMLRNDGWADISNLGVEPDHRGVGVATWLLGHAAQWLRLGRTRNLISYVGDDEVDSALHAWLVASGFQELNRTRRGWTRVP